MSQYAELRLYKLIDPVLELRLLPLDVDQSSVGSSRRRGQPTHFGPLLLRLSLNLSLPGIEGFKLRLEELSVAPNILFDVRRTLAIPL